MPAAPLFVAMCGARHDSHDFVDGMYARGVRAFLVERPLGERDGAGYVVVGNAIDALQRLAADWRRRFGGTVVGITGSNGKTVVKEWIAQTAPDGVKLFRSPRSYNSQLGAALSLLMIEGDERFALIEAGISQPGEMARLERMISPDVVLFTSLGDAHQEHFASVEEKCAEKLLLALHAPKIIYHSAYEPLASMLRKVYAAGHELHDAAAEAGGGLADAASERNSQLVAAFWRVAGGPGAPISGGWQRVAMRLEVKEGINDSLLVDDAYNSDINSLAIALDYLHGVAAGRPTTLILSDILQSGMDDDELYARVAAMVAAAGVGRFVGIGPKLQAQAERFVCDKAFYASTDDYLRRIDRADIAGRAVLLKGNRDSRFEKLEHALSRKSHTTVLEVDLDAMTHNLNYFRSHLRPGVRLVAMVKAASYGAGDFEVAQLLQHQGVDYLAVAFADEGVLLRERGITMPVVVLNADADSFDAMAANRLEPEIYSLRSLHGVRCGGRTLRRTALSDPRQARYGNASSGLRGGGVACAARCARPLRADGACGERLRAPLYVGRSRAGRFHAVADRAFRPHEQPHRGGVALSRPAVIRPIRPRSSVFPKRSMTCAGWGWGFTASDSSTTRRCVPSRRCAPASCRSSGWLRRRRWATAVRGCCRGRR